MSDIIRLESIAPEVLRDRVFEEVDELSDAQIVVGFRSEDEDSDPAGDMPLSGRRTELERDRETAPAPVVEEALPPAPSEASILAAKLDELMDRLEAERIEREDKIQEAYERGLADGEQRRAEADRRLAEHYAFGLERLNLLGKTLETLARHESLEIAILIAKRIIQNEIMAQPMLLVDLVKQAASEIMGKQELTIRLHPRDLAAVRETRPDLATHFPAVAQVSLAEDDSLEQGDCVVDTEVEQINLTLDEQLGEIKRALQEAIQ